MSRLARAVEILEAINKFYQEGDCTAALSGYALILDDDNGLGIAEAIKECLGPEECGPIVPRSKQRRWAFHFATGYSGWVGKRKMARFYTREEAIKWVNEQR